jgi:hypothetical protein
MNERIRELALQATTYIEPVPGHSGEGWIFDKEKFAELIVQECSEEIRKQGTDWIDWLPSQQGIRPEYVAMAEHIKKHFGVEE